MTGAISPTRLGMFAYTGLTAEQMDKLAKEVSFIAFTFRISLTMAALGLWDKRWTFLGGGYHVW